MRIRNRRAGISLTFKSIAATASLLAILGAAAWEERAEAQAQAPAPAEQPQPPDAGRDTRAKAGRARARNRAGAPVAPEKARAKAADPLARPGGAAAAGKNAGLAPGTFHYAFKILSFDESTTLASSYYPARPMSEDAPVVLLVHEGGRSRKDFSDPISEIKGQGLADHLQSLGFAVLSLDLRGQGQNPRRNLTPDDREQLVQDVQAGYQFLVDRHNRGELNVAKLAVLGMGAGANLVAAWAAQPGAAVMNEGRPSDLNALVLISPYASGGGYKLGTPVAAIANEIPILVLAGEDDKTSKEPVESISRVVEQNRLGRVTLFPSALHGYKLLRLEPKVTGAIVRFLEGAVKARTIEWEPGYNLNPVAITDIQTIANSNGRDDENRRSRTPEKTKARTKAGAKEQPREPNDAPKKPAADRNAPNDN
jgi:alpha-beta hydrolase superfamily lysophospholipase